MSYADPEAEEKTLETFFDRSKFTPGGETNQLRDACAAVERFIAQELWCDSCIRVCVCLVASGYCSVLRHCGGSRSCCSSTSQRMDL